MVVMSLARTHKIALLVLQKCNLAYNKSYMNRETHHSMG